MQFNYLEPKSIEEVVSLIIKYNGKAKVLAGGTDLLLQIRNKAIKVEYLIDIGGISGLDYINFNEKQGLAIGALTTIGDLKRSAKLRQKYPVIFQAAGQLGSAAIQNLGTIGGNLCNAAPSAEMPPALIGLAARAKIVGSDGERVVPLEHFFTGPGSTVLKQRELLVEIQVPVPPPHTKGVYLKHSIRQKVDLGIVGVAAIITLASSEVCRDIKIVLGAVAPTPIRSRKAEEVLKGKRVEEVLIDKSARVASEEARPISDVRASAEYRKEMIMVFTRRAIKEALAR